MITFRKAAAPDFQAIKEILDEFDFGHPSIRYEDFWAAFAGSEPVGVVNVKDCGSVCYINAVGVRPSYQRRGVARGLLNEILQGIRKPACLYTKMPDFFRRFGFVDTKPPPEILACKFYDCEKCPDRSICVCMMRPANVSTIS